MQKYIIFYYQQTFLLKNCVRLHKNMHKWQKRGDFFTKSPLFCCETYNLNYFSA